MRTKVALLVNLPYNKELLSEQICSRCNIITCIPLCLSVSMMHWLLLLCRSVAAQREKRSNSNNDKMIQHPTREAEHQALLGSTGDFLLYSNIMHLLKSENMLSLNRSTTKIVKVKSTEQIIYEHRHHDSKKRDSSSFKSTQEVPFAS